MRGEEFCKGGLGDSDSCGAMWAMLVIGILVAIGGAILGCTFCCCSVQTASQQQGGAPSGQNDILSLRPVTF
eukprot:TRINITY_DN6150_c0_g1_i1.p2 TRINITY_DN6150_c0_g1~~TRINITY_DN6150_c0_g1_i1.p2  ORF type:complete len:72 (-),score=2.42 TRINITY_DN6150_c0_g1_i1:48-263(-)